MVEMEGHYCYNALLECSGGLVYILVMKHYVVIDAIMSIMSERKAERPVSGGASLPAAASDDPNRHTQHSGEI